MITLAYIFILFLMTSGVFLIDYFLLHKSTEEMAVFLIFFYGGTHKWWIVSTLIVGLLFSILSDWKEHKKKQSKGLNNGQ